MRLPMIALCTAALGATLIAADCSKNGAGGTTPANSARKDSTATDTTPRSSPGPATTYRKRDSTATDTTP